LKDWMSLEEFFKISTSAFANHWFYMNTIYGYELNILETYIELSELSSEEQLYEIVKENLYKFDLDRETFPVNLNFDKSVTLNYENDLFAEYLNDYIVLGHYFIYEDASYEIIYETEIKELSASKFINWTVFEMPCKEDGEQILECLGTGKAIEEKTFALLKKGNEIIVISESIRAPFEFDDELSEDQEEILKKICSSIYGELSK